MQLKYVVDPFGEVNVHPAGPGQVHVRATILMPTDAPEIKVTGRDAGRITSAPGYASFGEAVRRSRNKSGNVSDIWLAGVNFKTERALSAEIERRYAKGKRRS